MLNRIGGRCANCRRETSVHNDLRANYIHTADARSVLQERCVHFLSLQIRKTTTKGDTCRIILISCHGNLEALYTLVECNEIER